MAQQGDVDEEAFRAYLASSSDSDSAASSIIDPDASDAEAEVGGEGKRKLRLSKKQRKVRNKYKSLLEGLVEFEEDDAVAADASGSEGDAEASDSDGESSKKKKKKSKKKKKKKKSKDDDTMMAWGAGEEVLKRIQEKKAHENETVFEREQRKLKEKRKAKRAARKAANEGGASATTQEQGGSMLEGDGFFVDGRPFAASAGHMRCPCAHYHVVSLTIAHASCVAALLQTRLRTTPSLPEPATTMPVTTARTAAPRAAAHG